MNLLNVNISRVHHKLKLFYIWILINHQMIIYLWFIALLLNFIFLLKHFIWIYVFQYILSRSDFYHIAMFLTITYELYILKYSLVMMYVSHCTFCCDEIVFDYLAKIRNTTMIYNSGFDSILVLFTMEIKLWKFNNYIKYMSHVQYCNMDWVYINNICFTIVYIDT